MKNIILLLTVVFVFSQNAIGGDWFHPDAEPEQGVAIMDDPHTGSTPVVARRNFVQPGSGVRAIPEVVERVKRWNKAVGFSNPENRYDVLFPKPQAMPCLTDSSVLSKIVADFRAWKAKRYPSKAVYFRLCCNDTGKWCECAKCKELMAPERGLTGVASDYWWTFVNKLADQILSDPLVSLDAFVYRNYQDFPQRVKPLRHPRLSVVLCPHGRCYTHSLNDSKCKNNAHYLAMFKQWADYGMPINTFEYFNQTPGRSNYAFWERAWIEDVKWYAKNGISHGDGNFLGPWAGSRRQDNYYRNNAVRARWQIAWLTAYFDRHPDADFDSVRDRLFAAYYREASRPMTQYRKLLEKAFLDTGACLTYGLARNLFFQMASQPGLLQQARRLLDEAREMAAGDTELLRRIGWDEEYFRTNIEWCGFDRADPELTLKLPATLSDFRLCKGAGDVPMKRTEKYTKQTSARVTREGTKLVIDISGDEGGEFRIHYMTEQMKGEYRTLNAAYGRNEIEVGRGNIVRFNISRNEKGVKKPYGTANGYPWFIPDYWFAAIDEADLVVYGATPAGYSAAIQARRMGKSVIVLEPSGHVGGLTAGGLGQTDIGSKDAFGGIAREFYQDIRIYYEDPSNWKYEKMSDYISNSPADMARSGGTLWKFEPSAASYVFSQWEKRYGLGIVRNARLARGGGGVVKEGGRIVAIKLLDGSVYRGKMFIDATYEGDLMAEAGVSYTFGREANSKYGEELNGQQPVGHPHHNFDFPVDPYVIKGKPSSGLLPGIDPTPIGKVGEEDKRIQAYCYRMTLTDDPSNRIPFAKPEGYNELEYELLFRNYEAGESTARIPWINSKMPNRKTDTNNSRGLSTDFIGRNHNWPEATYEEREKIAKEHLVYQQGLMWTLANHPRVPKAVRDVVSKWGMCRDEFKDRGGWTPQLYVREARRMVGEYVMTELNCRKKTVAPRPVALAAYQMDSHHTRRYVTKDGKVRNEGDVEIGCIRGPFGIDYGSIIPKRGECANLIVPVCLSASHIAFGSIRMEPVFFALGQAAGTAACLSIDDRVEVQGLDYSKLKDRLLKDGQRIVPTHYQYTPTPLPADFMEFWTNAISNLDREVPEDAKCELDESISTANFLCYRLSFATYGKGRRVYGFLSVPRNEKGPFPVRITVPGAGRGVIGPMKNKGCISLVMNVHDYEPKATREEQEAAYREANQRWGAPYGVKWYFHSGIQKSREDYFYYGAILGINRAVNWLARRNDVDLTDFTYRGQSQGGAFGLYLAALNKHITAATISEPAITDTLAFRAGRQSGWPKIIESQVDRSQENLDKVADRMRYFDGANFAVFVNCPTRWLAGAKDKLCPGECVHAGYARLRPGLDKRIVHGEDLGHGVPADVYKRFDKLLTASWEPIPKVLVGTDSVDKLAAEEFLKYYKLITGIKPEIASAENDKDVFVKIGRSFAGNLKFDKKLDSYYIKSTKKGGHWHLLLAGGNARSTMYAVYEFYKSLGCRWFWDGDKVPKTGVVDLSGQDVYEVTPFEWRGTRYFAHRGLNRFSAEMWGPEEWKREIDWLLKNRLNLFFFRLGMDDLFQKAFPEHCSYPDASKPLPGQLKGYDNRSLFWSLEYRGRIRKEFTDYAFDRGLMIPPDFGTITHWYTRTPQDFIDNAKPEFLPEPPQGYAAADSGKVWDVRKDEWMEAYWKITEAEIANYGRRPGPLHTIGFSERFIYTNKADNFKLKRDTTKRMFDRALKSYPDATILFAGWDFYSTWTAKEISEYLPTLDPKRVVILDYEANAYRKPVEGRHTIFTEWNMIGKFPYTFGTFFYESGTPIHTDYDLIAQRRKFAMGDPMCKGVVLWPEASHVDILEQFEFIENAWRFTNKPINSILDRFCKDRYGEDAKVYADLWRKTIPISISASNRQGVWRANYADMAYTYMCNDYSVARPRFYSTYGKNAFTNAPAIFNTLATCSRRTSWHSRDAADMARTVGDRLVLEASCQAQQAFFRWRDGKATEDEVIALADATIKFVDLMGRVLALHTDFSLNDTLNRTDEIERIRLPNFDKVFLQNAVNHYCMSHQAEPAVHLYPQMYRIWRDEMVRVIKSGDRAGEMKPKAQGRGLIEKLWEKNLADLKPDMVRNDANWTKTMLDFADAAAKWLAMPYLTLERYEYPDLGD